MYSSTCLFEQVYFQFRGVRFYFFLTELSFLKKTIFKTNSIEPEQTPHLWGLIRSYTIFQCPFMGIQIERLKIGFLRHGSNEKCMYFYLTVLIVVTNRCPSISRRMNATNVIFMFFYLILSL